MPDDSRTPDDSRISELVRMWIDGWVVSRGGSDPIDEPWGWTIDVGQAKHVARHVLPEPSEGDVRKIVAATSAPGTWLKLFAEDQEVLPWVGPGWRCDIPGFLMTCRLTSERPEVPAGYTLTQWTRGGVRRVLVRTHDGHFAARGQIAQVGDHAVVDQVETAPEHRRKGLGGLVMRTLQGTAYEAGARTGLLVGTPDGRALYSSMGWTTRSPMASLWYEPSDGAR
ncbi:GNAT family N-acetyltransferase [Streptomyces sp. NBC_00536]|uniref:GNAT family N-acetyltransferase n=1 Tax=Streptomyces sp. NBC_00536 TaxID=2975769 RepID=UPI002E80DC1F|nr:GNAT family N-acetyltransferase [Streptomyces sp. NBC_00536]WUC77671.1 GNAT family N-acetyltransferase [Streptomyces sp. NBC_00536]